MKTSLVVALLALAACGSFRAEPPKGFAEYGDGDDYRAVSPDGVVYRVRSEDNEPKADLAFWREALDKRMREAGYVVIGGQAMKAGGVDGHLLELAAPLGNRDYSYAVAVFVAGDAIVIVEAAGEGALLGQKRSDIVAAIEALSFR